MIPSRFWSKVNKTESCWEWNAALGNDGYGRFRLNGKTELTHRLSYEDKYDKIPKDLVINHKCRNRRCCNPLHLEVVTLQENIRLGLGGFVVGLRNRVKTHCPQGHEYNEENTYVHPSGKHRQCRACGRLGGKK